MKAGRMTQPQYAFPETAPEVDTSHILRKEFDLPYANLSQAQKLDIYWPSKGDGPFPVIISIHGGAFMFGDKRDHQLVPMLAGLGRGYAIVGVNYRMSGEATFPALVHDVKAAVRWVRANSANLQLDPERIVAWGGSAGGYLALMLGISTGVGELEDWTLGNLDQSSHVQGVVDWFGPTNFLKMDEQLAQAGLAPHPDHSHNRATSPESLLLGQQITEVPELVRTANPETYIRPGLPPFFIQHGDRDDIVPHQQSVNIAAKLSDVLGPEMVTLELLPGVGHGGPEFETDENLQKVFTFLDQILYP
jgi:acetyl esterase/lipase